MREKMLSPKQKAKKFIASFGEWHKYPSNIEAWATALFTDVGTPEFYYSDEEIETMLREIIQDIRDEYGD